jgi:hypothetical protein
MILHGKFSLYILLLLLLACVSESEQETIYRPQDPIDVLMDQVLEAHGQLGNYGFVFRDNTYSFAITDTSFRYTKLVISDTLNRKDVLTNDFFQRTENGETLDLSQKDTDKYSESLNAVIYFTCLPLNLDDAAVNKALQADIKINGKPYDVMQVTFDEEGGGTDHDDIFYYWFNKETHIMDYMAYSYKVNGGGVRFRSAYNSRMEVGMRFQDYVNYGAPALTPLDSLPILFEQNKLEELSKIETEQVYAF